MLQAEGTAGTVVKEGSELAGLQNTSKVSETQVQWESGRVLGKDLKLQESMK